jgi:hypothetical protein
MPSPNNGAPTHALVPGRALACQLLLIVCQVQGSTITSPRHVELGNKVPAPCATSGASARIAASRSTNRVDRNRPLLLPVWAWNLCVKPPLSHIHRTSHTVYGILATKAICTLSCVFRGRNKEERQRLSFLGEEFREGGTREEEEENSRPALLSLPSLFRRGCYTACQMVPRSAAYTPSPKSALPPPANRNLMPACDDASSTSSLHFFFDDPNDLLHAPRDVASFVGLL